MFGETAESSYIRKQCLPNQSLLLESIQRHDSVDKSHVQRLLRRIHACQEPHLTCFLLTCKDMHKCQNEMLLHIMYIDAYPTPYILLYFVDTKYARRRQCEGMRLKFFVEDEYHVIVTSLFCSAR